MRAALRCRSLVTRPRLAPLLIAAIAFAAQRAMADVARSLPPTGAIEDLFARVSADDRAAAATRPRLSADDGVWNALPPPRGRRAASVIYDPVRDRMLLFGGDDAGPADRNDIWGLSFTGTPAWHALAVSGSPPPGRRGHSAIYDPVRDRMVVFGGFDGSTFQNDVWALSLSGTPTWSPLAPGGTPPAARAAHSAIYDAGHDRMVVFGGFDGSSDHQDVWTLSLAGPETWAPVNPSGPAPRHTHSAIYDPTRDRMVIFGGVTNGTRLADAWGLDLLTNTWTDLSPSGPPPSNRYAPVAVYDPSDDRMVVFGGYDGAGRADVWSLTFSGTPAWSELSPSGAPPSGRWLDAAIYDSARDRLVTFGGEDGASPDYLDDAFALSLSGSPAWSDVGLPAVPTPRAFHSAIYDAAHKRMIVFGGATSTSNFNDTWGLPLEGKPVWTQIQTVGTPPLPRHAHSAIYDPRRDRMIVFGGNAGFPGGIDDVWALWLSGTPTWEQLFPTGTPPDRRSLHSAIYDPVRDRMVVFGGAGFFGRFSDTWELALGDTPAWTDIPVSGTWFETSRHAAIYDPIHDGMVVYGGDSASPYSDGVLGLLQFPGPSSWIPLLSMPPPYGWISSSAIYDLTRERLVVFGGTSTASYGGAGFRETWAVPLTDPSFSQLLPAGEAPWMFTGHTAIYDSIRDRMVVFGGSDGTHKSHDTFALSWTQTVSVGPREARPGLRLGSPRPNPTRGSAALAFALPAPGHAALDIFDLNGRRVRRLASGWFPAGEHECAWNGRDESGRALEAGVYFACLESNGARAVRRIVRLE